MNTQDLIHVAAMIATKQALLGQPLSGLSWIPPQSAGSSPRGSWALEHCPPLSASDTAPWDRL